jgi:Raf kinase inhibitor-like YbhB/YbcL family protein
MRWQMRLTSRSFTDGASIPDDCALAVRGPKGHLAPGRNRNPHLAWSDVPDAARSFVLVCHDPDVPSRADDVNKEGRAVPASLPRVTFFHWLLLDIPTSMREILPGTHSDGVVCGGKVGSAAPNGMRNGINDYAAWFCGDRDMRGEYHGYDGPCPPWNDERVHRYVFTLHALDVPQLPVRGSLNGANVTAALAGHVLTSARLTGTYSLSSRDPSG